MVRFGVALYPDQPLDRILEVAVRADEAGLDYLWVMDHKTLGSHNVWVFLGVLAERTKHIQLGPGVSNIFLWHPTLVARMISSLSHFSDGRAILGMGVGAMRDSAILGNIESQLLKHRRIHPLTALRDSVALIRGLSSGEKFSYQGKVFSTKDDQVMEPLNKIPIYLGSKYPISAKLAGKIADGMLTGASLSFLPVMIDQVRKGAKAVRRTLEGFRIANLLPFAVSKKRIEARNSVLTDVMFSLLWAPPASQETLGVSSKELRKLRSTALKDMDKIKPYITEEIIDEFAVAGTSEDCLKGIESYLKAGATEICFTLPLEVDVTKAFNFLKTQVIPIYSH